MCENAESGVAPCQCFSCEGMCTTSPGTITCCSVSVAMMPLPAVTHLITAVRVHLVPRARAEVHDAQIEVLARLGGAQRLPWHRTAGEQGSCRGVSCDLLGLCTFMEDPPLRAIVPSALLAGVRLPRGIRATERAQTSSWARAF